MDFLVVDDDKIFRDAACLLIEEEGHRARPAGSDSAALAELEKDDFDAVLLDVKLGGEDGLDLLPRVLRGRANLPVVMLTAQGHVDTAVEAMRRGAVDFLEKPFLREQFHRALARVQRFHQMSRTIGRLEQEARDTQSQNPELLLDFASPQMRKIMEVLVRAARSPASILLLGESGTGKSALARVAHQQSRLRDKPFVTVSCPSLSRELLESELFGHAQGAFTGAVKDRWGKVKAADGGTLFLDEIGDLPAEIQPKLLRLLQEREYERVGENITRTADVRIIAATNRDLRKRMAEGLFREDLFFRLNVISVEMPPLRSRPGDLQRLAGHYLTQFARQFGRNVTGFSSEALARINSCAWPGNLRELRNAVERAVVLCRQDRIEADDLPLDPGGHAPDGQPPPQPGDLISMEKLKDFHIRRVLERTGSVAEAARILGIDDATIYRKRKKTDLP
ncbi:MAG: sigma-54 dependent transcriptional regulator [Verrucomicrobiota bacterium]